MASGPFGKDQSVVRDHFLASLMIFGDISSETILHFGLRYAKFKDGLDLCVEWSLLKRLNLLKISLKIISDIRKKYLYNTSATAKHVGDRQFHM